MPIYTAAIYTARELAMQRMQQEARAWGAEGIVGVNLATAHHIWGHHAVEFLSTGTGVRRHGRSVQPIPDPVIITSLDG